MSVSILLGRQTDTVHSTPQTSLPGDRQTILGQERKYRTFWAVSVRRVLFEKQPTYIPPMLYSVIEHRASRTNGTESRGSPRPPHSHTPQSNSSSVGAAVNAI